MAEVLLEIKNLRKVFEDNAEVLKDFNLSVEKGEVVSIIGPSGSGKTTALRCATMLTPISGGSITYIGRKAVWEEALTAILSGENLLLVGPKATGKNVLAEKR